MKPFLYREEVRQLAEKLSGNETIHMGIRPYGYHAGNTLALEVYPQLICEELERQDKTAAFTFILSLNDWEQDALEGPDIYKYPFDVGPRDTIIKYMRNGDVMAKWVPYIIKRVSRITKHFSNVTVRPVFNSDLLGDGITKTFIMKSFSAPEKIKRALLESSKKPTAGRHTKFCVTVCAGCHSTSTSSRIVGSDLEAHCNNCGIRVRNIYRQFDYWLYHKISFINRLAVYRPDVALSGGDHYLEGDHKVRVALAEKIFPDIPVKIPMMLFSPVLKTTNGTKMSKSRMNERQGNLKDIYALAAGESGPTVTYA